MFPWLQQTFVGDDDCVTSPKNVCTEIRRLNDPKQAKLVLICNMKKMLIEGHTPYCCHLKESFCLVFDIFLIAFLVHFTP